jgi:glutamine amidotransferase
MWADGSLPDLARSIRTTSLVAAARNGTTGMPVTESACAPFRHGRWLFSHNGLVAGWPASVESLAESLTAIDLMRLEAPTDSALLWALACVGCSKEPMSRRSSSSSRPRSRTPRRDPG